MEKSEFKQIIEELNHISQCLSSILQEDTVYKKQLSHCEAEEQDLLHEIEFEDLSRTQRSAVATKLKGVRETRRQIKDTLELISPCMKLVQENSKIVFTLSSLAGKLQEVFNVQETRVYTPRVRTDLQLISSQKLNVRTDKNGKVKIVK